MSPTPEARAERRHENVILQWRVTLICFMLGCVTFAGAFFYVTRATNRVDAARQRSDQQFSKALLVTDRKFQQALRVTTQQFAYAQNKQVCAFRDLTIPNLKSYQDAAKDPTLSDSARARNDKRIHVTERFLVSLVTIPLSFDCASLPKNPPKPGP